MPKLPETWRPDVLHHICAMPGEKKLTIADIARKYGVKYATASVWKKKVKGEIALREKLGMPPLEPPPPPRKSRIQHSLAASQRQDRPDPMVRVEKLKIEDKGLRELVEEAGGEILTTKELLATVSALAEHGAPNIQLSAIKLLDELKRAYAPEEERGPGRPRSYEQRVERLKVILDAVGEKATRAALSAIYPSLLRKDSPNLEHPVEPHQQPADDQRPQASPDADCQPAQPIHSSSPPAPSRPEPEAPPSAPQPYRGSDPDLDEDSDESHLLLGLSPAPPPFPEE